MIVLSEEAMTKNANVVKDLVLERLIRDNKLTIEEAEDYSINWNIVVLKPSWFKKWCNKFRPKSDSETYVYKLINFNN